uniref:hypothetical protein n=1 Tax=Thiolapillus sp. TaxID=2017437 RepID=UPI003AF981B4
FLDLAEEGFTGSGLFLCVQLKMNLDARQVLVEAVRPGMPLRASEKINYPKSGADYSPRMF